MKKLLAFLLAVMIITATLPFGALTVSADREDGEGFYYTYDLVGGNAVITGFDSDESIDVVVPSTLGGCPVTSIGDNAFQFCDRITSVKIPDSVTSIGKYAFAGCRELSSITISDSVISIGDFAFENCYGLSEVTLSGSVKSLGKACFGECTSLEELYIPAGVTYVAGDAVSTSAVKQITVSNENPVYKSVDGVLYTKGGTKLVAFPGGRSGVFTIPSSVTTVGQLAFSSTELTGVIALEGLTTIEEYGLNSGSLAFVVLPKSLTTVYYEGLSERLSDIFYTGSFDEYCSKGFPYYDATVHDNYNYGSPIIFSGNLDGQGSWSLNAETGLFSLSDTTTTGDYDLYKQVPWKKYKPLITNIDFPEGFTTISSQVFSECYNLSEVTIPNGVTSIGDYAFYNSRLTKITIPDSVTFIGAMAFAYCGIKDVAIPDSLTSLNENVFYLCGELETVSIPGSVTFIGNGAFAGCGKITDVYYDGDKEDWYAINVENTWHANDFLLHANIHLNDGSVITHDEYVEGYYTYALSEQNKATIISVSTDILGDITIPSQLGNCPVTEIAESAFSECSDITAITIPDTVVNIEESAFFSCSSLKTVSFPASVERIGYYAFFDCPIKDVYYQGSKKEREAIWDEGGNESIMNAAWHYAVEEIKFPDVNLKDWYGDAVSYAVSAGLMKGYGSGKFGTADGIQRQDFVVILSRLSGDDLSQYEGKTSFKDVSKGAYYAVALAWAKAKGVSSGYANGKFGVGDKVTREQIMVFLYNYAKLKGYDTTATMTEAQAKATYADFGKVSGYAKEAALWALSKGVVSGKDAGGGKKLIAPQANALRCEVAAMFYNISEKGIFA